ncbi:MAG TPA: MogA/MoaB family molybdenum cofactor biosynthesis protein [Candidatus Acidoferrales bacterium]|nr:MogA/MoaB family molybdenum cofactor biosynthesis protein [Candidatus Acidoferrales bacterium]
MRVAILTISDSVSRGTSEDRSGPALVERCKALGWEVVSQQVSADDGQWIEGFLKTVADSRAADLILTTGGTGLGPRDVTPEATMAVADRLIPGFAEQMRAEGMKKTPRAIMSRAVAGIRGTSIIINLPGSPKGAVESLDAVACLLPHAIEVLHGHHHG